MYIPQDTLCALLGSATATELAKSACAAHYKDPVTAARTLRRAFEALITDTGEADQGAKGAKASSSSTGATASGSLNVDQIVQRPGFLLDPNTNTYTSI